MNGTISSNKHKDSFIINCTSFLLCTTKRDLKVRKRTVTIYFLRYLKEKFLYLKITNEVNTLVSVVNFLKVTDTNIRDSKKEFMKFTK